MIRRFFKRQEGVAAIEFALIAPVFFLALMASVEYGVFFLKSQQVQSQATLMAHEVNASPWANDRHRKRAGDASSESQFVCASGPYQSYQVADRATITCEEAKWALGDAYVERLRERDKKELFVKIAVRADTRSMTGLMDSFLPSSVKESRIVRVVTFPSEEPEGECPNATVTREEFGMCEMYNVHQFNSEEPGMSSFRVNAGTERVDPPVCNPDTGEWECDCSGFGTYVSNNQALDLSPVIGDKFCWRVTRTRNFWDSSSLCRVQPANAACRESPTHPGR